MDSSWLGFSLSNNNLHSSSCTSPHDSSSSQLLFPFEAFTTTSTTSITAPPPPQQDQDHGFSGTPKLEDFLGSSCTTPPQVQPQPPQLQQHAQQLGHHPFSTDQIYDFELKNIAASFLRGFSTEQQHQQQQQQTNITTTQKQQQLQLISPHEPPPKKSIDTFGQRTSIYRGVTRHRWTGRYEAHLWDNSCRREGQSRKGRQVYLGGYDKEDKAARAYDLAALKYWGPTTTTNFPVSNYEKELEDMKNMTRQEFVASLRRKSSGFSRGASIYRGVTRHHQHGRWQARIGRVAGNKDLYLGTFSTQEEAAEAYDIAAIKFRGLNAVTNFDMSRYDVKSIANSNLPIGGITGKSKNSSESASDSKSLDGSRSDDRDLSSAASSMTFASAHQHPPHQTSTLSFAMPIKQDPSSSDYWSNILGCQTLNAKNQPTLFQSCTNGSSFQSPTSSSSFHMDFSANNNNNNGLLLNGGYNSNIVEQQQIGTTSNTSSSIPFATTIPMGLGSSNNGGGYENSNSSSGYGNWINAQSLHSFQSAKSNLSVFQTPIFGME